MKNYLAVELKIANLLSAGQQVNYQGNELKIIKSGLVSYSGRGEGKTDIYVKLSNGEELKISVKKSNADFIENKLKKERAIQLFGEELFPLYTAIDQLKGKVKNTIFYS